MKIFIILYPSRLWQHYLFVPTLFNVTFLQIVRRSLPKKLKAKNDPAVIEKTERDKIRKAWINIVRRDIPKHHRIFTTFHRKQSIDAKRFVDGCQREVTKLALVLLLYLLI